MPIHDLHAYLRVKDANEAVRFYKSAFGATELFRLVEPGGRIGHVELDFNGTKLMLSEEFPAMDVFGPESIGGTSVGLYLRVDDADEVIRRAAHAGAEVIRPAADQFHGERSGTVRDPFGHEWLVSHEMEKVTPEEMQRRYTRMFSGE